MPRRRFETRPAGAPQREADEPPASSARLPHLHAVEMSHDLVEVHHVGIFVMHVEQIDLVRKLAAVETAFLHQYDMEAVGIGVDRSELSHKVNLFDMQHKYRSEEHTSELQSHVN